MINIYLKLSTAIALLYLVGCMVGPNYKHPDVEVPSSFRYEPNFVAETANIQWWQQFHDPVLNQLISEALANNRDVKRAAANIIKACGILMTTRSELFPQMNYSLAASRNRFSETDAIPPPTPDPFNNFQVLAGVNWEVDLWGRIRRLSESTKANLFASMEARHGVILSLVAEVAASYIQLRAYDEQLRISKNSLKSYRISKDLFELQYKHGQVSLTTVEQARSQYQTAAATIPQIEIQIAQTENAISVLLGRNPGPIPRGRPIAKLSMPAVPAGLPAQLLERRPDILQAEDNLIAANALIGANIALYFPTISLTGTYGQSSDSLSTLFNGASSVWSFGGSIVGPIFTAGAIKGKVIQAKADTNAALFAYEQIILNAFKDVENSLVSWTQLQKKYSAEQKKVQAYKSYRSLAWLKYNGGYSPYFEVLFAETQLFPAELQAVQTKAGVFISLVNIYKAMGGGWVIEAEKMTCVSAPPAFRAKYCSPKTQGK